MHLSAIPSWFLVQQLILVKHSVRRLGVGGTLVLLPLVSVVGFAMLAIHPVFAIMAALQVIRRSLTFGFSKPTSDMLYSVVTPEEKYKVKNFIETAVYRSGDLISVWTIRLLTAAGLGMTAVSIITIPVSIIWTVLALWIGREYNRRASDEQ